MVIEEGGYEIQSLAGAIRIYVDLAMVVKFSAH